MIYKEKFKIPLKDIIGENNVIKNRAILEIFENVATHQSDSLSLGPNDTKNNKVTWVLLDWKFKVLKRPQYGQVLEVKTWGRNMKRSCTFRDFEVYDENNNLSIIRNIKVGTYKC